MRADLFEFCNSETYGSCSVFTFNVFSVDDKVVSEYYYKVRYPACQDTFSASEAAWASLSDSPPTDFTQDYYACKAKPLDALFNSMGIAAGKLVDKFYFFMH